MSDRRWTIILVAAALAALGFVIWVLSTWMKRRLQAVIIFEYQTGLRYKNGRFAEALGPGRYAQFWPGTTIHVEDLREQLLVVPGQEMLTADNLAVKISLAVNHRTVDARQKQSSAKNQIELIYNDLQVAMRQSVAMRTLEALLTERGGMAADLKTAVAGKAAARGIEIMGVEVRDLMLSGETKRAYTEIFRAKKEGEAQLERARGETAALRNLANGARMLEGNPALFNLRLLQTMAASKGATVVLNTSGQPLVMAVAPAQASKDEPTE